jgi:hypothetical protein
VNHENDWRARPCNSRRLPATVNHKSLTSGLIALSDFKRSFSENVFPVPWSGATFLCPAILPSVQSLSAWKTGILAARVGGVRGAKWPDGTGSMIVRQRDRDCGRFRVAKSGREG